MKDKTWSKALLFLILGLIVIAGIIFAVTLIPKNPKTPAGLRTGSATGWKTYADTKLGLSFLFPQEWESCYTGGISIFLQPPGKCNPPQADNYLVISWLTDTTEVYEYSPPGDPNDYISSGKQVVVLGSNSFIKQKFTLTKPMATFPAGSTVIFYNLVDSGKNRVIEFEKPISSKADESTIEQILSTLKLSY